MRYKEVRKALDKRQKKAIEVSRRAEISIDKNIFSRFDHLLDIKRFVGGWLLFWFLLVGITAWQMTALAGYFQTLRPVPGGIYNEGILGTLTNANPIYATSEVDSSLSRLIFAGLLTYNSQNQLVDCLARNYSVSNSGKVYTINLKPNLKWQDGKPLTASDVIYTINMIQNPSAQSPLYSSWQGIKVKKINSLTLTFSLPNPLASFPYLLTVGILPQHILGRIPAASLRSATFNTDNPIGAGPFSWHEIQVNGNTPSDAIEQIALLPFDHYTLGKPKLSEFIIHAYANRNQLVHAFTSGQLTAVAGLDKIPKQIKSMQGVKIHSLILTAGDYVFFKTQNDLLSDVNIRRALVLASNPQAIISKLGYTTLPVNEPLLIGQLAYNSKYAQITNNLSEAKSILQKDGWNTGKDGIRTKNGQSLSLNLVTTNTPENHLVVRILEQQWHVLGVHLMPVFESADTYSTTLQDHNYDMTLDGISIGIDPDVFVYWDSSQYDPRSTDLNLSEYNSSTADSALEAGRTRLNPALRVIKYQPFLSSWQSDEPALGLYQPRSLYITRQSVYGLRDYEINNQQGRYNNVQNWEILTAGVTDSKP